DEHYLLGDNNPAASQRKPDVYEDHIGTMRGRVRDSVSPTRNNGANLVAKVHHQHFESRLCGGYSASNQADCFCAGRTGVFRAMSRANLNALNRAVFSRVAKRAASYSAIAC